jgi:hypothetical protein
MAFPDAKTLVCGGTLARLSCGDLRFQQLRVTLPVTPSLSAFVSFPPTKAKCSRERGRDQLWNLPQDARKPHDHTRAMGMRAPRQYPLTAQPWFSGTFQKVRFWE